MGKRIELKHSVWYLYMMLIVFWPLSVYEYFKIKKGLKQRGYGMDWRVRVLYHFMAPTVSIVMSFIWYCFYYYAVVA